MTDKFAANPYYAQYEDRLKELHRLIAAGKGDSEEADALREAMERLERELTHEEIERLGGLSADLYMLQDDEIYEPLEPGEEPSDREPERLRARLQEAWERPDPEATLALLRKGTAGLSEDQRASLRARAYEEIGHLDTALLFVRYAAEHAPQVATYKLKILDLLEKLDRLEERYAQASEYIEQAESLPEVLLQSAGVLFGSTRGMTPEQAAPVCEAAIRAVRSALDRLGQATHPLAPFHRAFGLLTLGLCYRKLGRHKDALDALNKALEADSTREGALVARGMLLVETDPAGALADFEKAAEMNTSLIAPYIHLAYDALIRDDEVRCLEMCDRALVRIRDPRVRAVVWQWAAIARFQMEGLTGLVRQAFALAMTLDPLNLEIRQNFDLVQQRAQSASTASPPRSLWQLSSPPNREGGEQILSQLSAGA